MSFFNKYPYSDMHELNLDWIIAKMKELNIAFDEFKVINQITFSGAWDITKQYPAWTIVSDNNIGYVSIQPVPAGVLLTNGDYWREVIDYTAQIAGLQSRVVALENEDIILHAADTALSNRISRLENRFFLFLGDSYYLGGTGITYTGIGWASQVINDMGLNSDHYFLTPAEDVINPDLTVSLPGFYPSAGTHKSFKTILELSAARLTAEEKAKVTDVVVAGGYNDRTQGANIETGEAEYAVFAKATFPNATLWVAHIAYSTNPSDKIELRETRRRYRNCVKYGLTYIDAAEYVLSLDTYMDAGGVHPIEAGYKQIGHAIANALQGGGCAYSPIGSYSLSTLTQFNLYAGNLICNYNEYGKKVIVFSQMILINPSPTAVSQGTPLKVYFDNPAIQPDGDITFQIYLDLHEAGGSDNWIQCTIKFAQDNTGKYFEITPIDTSFNKVINSVNIPSQTFLISSYSI